jgi:hypothetical protein
MLWDYLKTLIMLRLTLQPWHVLGLQPRPARPANTAMMDWSSRQRSAGAGLHTLPTRSLI